MVSGACCGSERPLRSVSRLRVQFRRHWTLDFGLWTQLHFENVGAVAAAVAVGTADEDVAEELHLDLLEAGSPAPFTLALGRIEAEGTGVEAALPGLFGLGENFPDVIKRANIDGRIRARGLAKDGLVHQHNAAEVFGTVKEGRGTRGEGRVAGL